MVNTLGTGFQDGHHGDLICRASIYRNCKIHDSDDNDDDDDDDDTDDDTDGDDDF